MSRGYPLLRRTTGDTTQTVGAPEGTHGRPDECGAGPSIKPAPPSLRLPQPAPVAVLLLDQVQPVLEKELHLRDHEGQPALAVPHEALPGERRGQGQVSPWAVRRAFSLAGWRTHLLVLAGYLALAILFTWPLVLHFTTALPGQGADSWQYLWNFWWFDQALFHSQPLYFTHAQYYPLGTSLIFHTLSPLNSVLGLPAQVVGGYLAAYNFVVLLSTVLSGYGTYLLVRQVLREHIRSRPAGSEEQGGRRSGRSDLPIHLAAFLGGAVFALAPYRSVHLLGHLSLVSTETLPFFALFAWQALRRPGWKPALGVGLSWLAAMLIDWYYPLYMVLLAGLFLAWALGETLLRRRSWPSLLHAGLTIGAGMAAAALLLSPLLLPMVRGSHDAAYLEEPLTFSSKYGADLGSFFLPSPQQPLWGKAFVHTTDAFGEGNTAEGIVYMGLVAILLASLGLWRARGGEHLWALTIAAFGLLSLGPTLRIFNHKVGSWPPYLLFYRLPIVRITRVPSRFEIMMHLALAVLAGLGVWGLLSGEKRRKTADSGTSRKALAPALAYALTGALLALVVLDYLPIPYKVTPATMSPFYQQIAQDPEHYALLEVPMQGPNGQWYYTRWMLYQTVHGKDSFHGYISRGDPVFPAREAPVFRQFIQPKTSTDITYDDWRSLVQTVFSYYRIRYIVLEKNRLQDEDYLAQAQELVQQALGPATPTYQDDEIAAYRVEWGPVTPFLRPGNGWHDVEEQPWGPFRWMERDRSELYVILPEAQDVTINFQATSFLRPRRLEVLLDGQAVASWEISTDLQLCSFSVRLPAGENLLEFRTDGYDSPVDLGMGDDTRQISVGFSALRIK